MGNTNDDDHEQDSYADLEFVNLAVQLGASDDTFSSLDPLAEELERNQIAELITYERQIGLEQGEAEIGVGFNVADNTFIEQAAGNQPNPDSFDEASLGGALYDESGILDFARLGNPNTAEGANERVYKDFRSLYGDGPFIDSTDDLDVHLEFNDDSGNPGGSVEAHVQFGYAIHSVAQGVPRFSDPRNI